MSQARSANPTYNRRQVSIAILAASLLMLSLVACGGEGTEEEEEYNSLLPSPKVETPEEIQSVLYGWYGLAPGKKVLLVATIVISVLCVLSFYCDI